MAGATVAAAALVAVAVPATAQPTAPAGPSGAAAKASALVAARPAYLHASADETFVQRPVVTSGGLSYVPFERTYKGLPVRGGDFVVALDRSGRTTHTSVAQSRAIGALSTTPALSAARGLAVAKKQLDTVSSVEGTRLVVDTTTGPARLAWESTVNGTGHHGVSRLTVSVDAATGAVLDALEHVTNGTGTGWINGEVTVNTVQSGGTFRMQDPTVTSLACQDSANNTTFSGPDDVWGNGTPTSRETGCVDALYSAQRQAAMLSTWLGRNGQNGNGGAWPIRVGLNQQNAFYDGNQIQIGRNGSGAWITSADVVGHELGHGIDDTTPGSISRGNTQEFVADAIGAATEAFAANPNDPPDYEVGEEVNLVGNGPIRYMYDPSRAGHDNCYSSRIPSQGVHAASGPGNHWFYLLSEGSNPTNGQPVSPTCNNTTITGIGIEKAIKILYNAMLTKTTASSYLRYRTWTLQAARNLFPNGCTEFNTVKAAWDAVSVPVQSDEPTCGGTPTPTPTTTSPTPTPTTTTTPASCTGTNDTDVAIPDNGPAVFSDVAIGGCGRNASATTRVAVDITHTYRGDLQIDLVAPDGTSYRLKSTSGDSADNVRTTYTVNASSEAGDGTWRLRVQDRFSRDTGTINSWTLTL